MQYWNIFFLVGILIFVSCEGKKKQLSFYDNSDLEYAESDDDFDTHISFSSSEEISVPFDEQGGVKLIDVTVNRKFTVKMILDSGCSSTLISAAEAKYLYETGSVSNDDFIGITKAQIADGSIVDNMVIRLKEVVIGGKISCSNVIATVSTTAQAPLLLGNEVLNRVPSYSVDNVNKVIKFRLQE